MSLICSQDRGYDTPRIRDRDAQLQAGTSGELASENHQKNERMKIILPPRPVSYSCARVVSRLCREFRSSSTLAQHAQIFPSGFQASSVQRQLALEHLQLSCGCQPTASRPSVQNRQCHPGPLARQVVGHDRCARRFAPERP